LVEEFHVDTRGSICLLSLEAQYERLMAQSFSLAEIEDIAELKGILTSSIRILLPARLEKAIPPHD
jgi:hypothetical protein